MNVSAANATIDPNIIPGNIKDGVSILGVNGSLIATSFGMDAPGWGGSGVKRIGNKPKG